MVRFSSHFSSFRKWLKSTRRTSQYAKKIISLHELNPKTTLYQLRKGSFKKFDPSLKSWNSLTPELKSKRLKSLEALRKVRKGDSLRSALFDVGLSLKEGKLQLRSSLVLRNKRFVVKSFDRIERAMKIYSKGEIKTIVVTNSKDASLIGEYFSAIRNFLETWNKDFLKLFKNKTITDSEGKKYKLESNPEKIRDIEEAKEDSEFFEVYADEWFSRI